MVSNTGYLLYQAERPMTHGEQRAADARNGMLAESFTRLLRSFRQRRFQEPQGSIAISGCMTPHRIES